LFASDEEDIKCLIGFEQGGLYMASPRQRRSRSEVGRQLEDARSGLGWSLREAERRSGVSNSYISQIEKGDVDPSPDVLRRLAAAYGVPFEVLMEAAGYLMRRSDPKPDGIPAFVFSAAEQFDERDWDAAQAFFRSLLEIKRKRLDDEAE
jgi:transcriptional regulator with XRE-family HTH domain